MGRWERNESYKENKQGPTAHLASTVITDEHS